MDIYRMCAVAVLAAVCCIILKKLDAPISGSVSIVCVAVLAASAMSGMVKISDFITRLEGSMPAVGYLPYVWKGAGIMFITEYSSQVCEEAGEGGLAKALCAAGRIEMIVISLPLFSELCELALGVMGG